MIQHIPMFRHLHQFHQDRKRFPRKFYGLEFRVVQRSPEHQHRYFAAPKRDKERLLLVYNFLCPYQHQFKILINPKLSFVKNFDKGIL